MARLSANSIKTISNSLARRKRHKPLATSRARNVSTQPSHPETGVLSTSRGHHSRLQTIAQSLSTPAYRVSGNGQAEKIINEYYDDNLIPLSVRQEKIQARKVNDIWSQPLQATYSDDNYHVESFSDCADHTDDEEQIYAEYEPVYDEPEYDNSSFADTDDTEEYEDRHAFIDESQDELYARDDRTDDVSDYTESIQDENDFINELSLIKQKSENTERSKAAQAHNPYASDMNAFDKEVNKIIDSSNKSKRDKNPSGLDTEEQEVSKSKQDLGAYKGLSSGLANHGMFDKAGANEYTNTFNLGSVDIGKRFDQFDLQLDKEEQHTQATIARNLGLDPQDVSDDISQITSDAINNDDNAINDIESINQNNQSDRQNTSAEELAEATTEQVAEQAPDQPEEDKPQRDLPRPTLLEEDVNTIKTPKLTPVNYEVPVIMASDQINHWAAAAAMLTAWQLNWPTDQLFSNEPPWNEYQSKFNTTGINNLGEWGLAILDHGQFPQSPMEWTQLLLERGPVILCMTDNCMLITAINGQVNFIRTDQGRADVAYENFEEVIARIQHTEQPMLAVLENDEQTHLDTNLESEYAQSSRLSQSQQSTVRSVQPVLPTHQELRDEAISVAFDECRVWIDQSLDQTSTNALARLKDYWLTTQGPNSPNVDLRDPASFPVQSARDNIAWSAVFISWCYVKSYFDRFTAGQALPGRNRIYFDYAAVLRNAYLFSAAAQHVSYVNAAIATGFYYRAPSNVPVERGDWIYYGRDSANSDNTHVDLVIDVIGVQNSLGVMQNWALTAGGNVGRHPEKSAFKMYALDSSNSLTSLHENLPTDASLQSATNHLGTGLVVADIRGGFKKRPDDMLGLVRLV